MLDKLFGGRKPFPKFIITIALLIFVALVWLFVCVIPPVDALIAGFYGFGQFICDFDILLIAIILAVNVVEFIGYVKYGKRDEAINVRYEALFKKLSYFTMFKQYFAPMFTRGPLLFATEERDSAKPRTIVGIVIGAIKFVYWLVVGCVVMSSILRPEYYEATLTADPDYMFTFLILYCCINCNVLVYAIYRILPLYKTQDYKVTTYYSDGSSESHTETESNLFAILFLAGFIYLFNSAYYPLSLGSKINRIIETERFTKYIDSCDENQCINDFFQAQ